MWNVFPSADDLFVYNCPRRTEDDEDVVGLATLTWLWVTIFVSCDKYRSRAWLAPQHFRPDLCFYLQIAPHSSPAGRYNKTTSALSSNSRYPPRATRGLFAVKVRAKLFELTISG